MGLLCDIVKTNGSFAALVWTTGPAAVNHMIGTPLGATGDSAFSAVSTHKLGQNQAFPMSKLWAKTANDSLFTSHQIYFVIATQSKLIRLSVFLPFPLPSCCPLLAAEALFSSFNFLQTFLINFFHEINGCNNLAIRNSWLGWNSSNLFLRFLGLQREADGWCGT